MTKLIHGVVHGQTIELQDDPGVPEGQEVEILVRSVVRVSGRWGDGLRRCAGVLQGDWTEEDDRILDAIYQERKRDTRPPIQS